MKASIESLSLGSAAALIAILSAIIVWFLCAVWPRQYKGFWVVIVPLALSTVFTGLRLGSTSIMGLGLNSNRPLYGLITTIGNSYSLFRAF